MFRSQKVATPLHAHVVNVPFSVPPPGLLPRAMVTSSQAVSTRFPYASTICTWTGGEMVIPATVVDGCVTNESAAGAPGVTVANAEPWMAGVAESAAVMDWVPVVPNVTVPLATPPVKVMGVETTACGSDELTLAVPE